MKEETTQRPDLTISYADLDSIYRTLNDACEIIRAKYPGANWAERKGMKLMMDEICEAEEKCLVLLRPVLAAELEAEQLVAES